MPEEVWTEVCNVVQEVANKTIPKKKKMKKAKWLSTEALQIVEEWGEVNSKGERERYIQLNSDFQTIAGRDKKVLFNEQCLIIEENNKRDYKSLQENWKEYFGHLMRRVDSSEKTLMLGGIGGRRRRGRPRMRWLDGIMDWMDVSLSELQATVMNRKAWRAAIHGVAKSRTWLSDWTELNWTQNIYF